ncbi:beta-ketoacyl-[acyl-carrier-protein] synthase family protein [Streptomyces sp. NPDC053048]|uniref:beta-ketoacyl-[acyl-carrier-protein] synthase family protein n=1 Tax=Streptomyces sp. NPDC053048 TaxID=3365694 RepID=UPI0037CE52F5
MTGGVAVTGIGLLTPAGLDAESSWQRLCAGRAFAEADPLLAGLPVDFSCPLTGFDARALFGRKLVARTDRFVHMALAAATRAVEDAGLSTEDIDPCRIGIVLGVASNSAASYDAAYGYQLAGDHDLVSPLTMARSLPNMAAGEVAARLGLFGPNLTITTACAAGANALGVARDLIRSGTCDVVLAGGSESARTRSAALWFARLGALSTRRHDPQGASRPFDRDRDGFVLAEGAAVLVLERPEHARARRAGVQAVISGYGAAGDAHHPTAPHPDGRGIEHAVTAALADAGITPADIDHVSAHSTSTPAGDLVEARVLRRVFQGHPPPVTAVKGALGHTLGAAGAVQAAVAVLSLRHQAIPPTANLDTQDPDIDLDIVTKVPRQQRQRAVLSNSSGFGGANAALVVCAP